MRTSANRVVITRSREGRGTLAPLSGDLPTSLTQRTVESAAREPRSGRLQLWLDYEVTFVQFLHQYLLMSPFMSSFQIFWEMPYQPANAPGHPFQVDIELRNTSGTTWDRMLIEVGQFSSKKLKDDSEKLRDLRHKGEPVTGEKRVLLYWNGSDAPKVAAAIRELVRARQSLSTNIARMGTHRVLPLWVRGFELFTPASFVGSQFSAVMFQVLQ